MLDMMGARKADKIRGHVSDKILRQSGLALRGVQHDQVNLSPDMIRKQWEMMPF